MLKNVSKIKLNKSFSLLTSFPKFYFSTRTEFEPVAESVNFPKEEEKILAYWKRIDAFKRQLELTRDKEPYTFYDGPPFATGLPHYGHICAGTIKDVITRYAAQNGRYVERRFGWDCHGLPIEYEIDKAYGIRTRDDVHKIGIAEYNKLCRGIVMRYSSEWEEIIGRLGRWIDFRNDYKTMDLKFMESVWWAFKQLWDKGLVYRSAKVMPYSNGCSTVLSNFEAGSNYQMVNDPSIFIEFPLVNDPGVSLVAWTTTPWTLPSNLALAVNPNFDYLKIKDTKRNKVFIIAENRMVSLYDSKKKEYEVLGKYKGSELVGLEYQPLFNYFDSFRSTGCFRVLAGDFVSSDSGTGVVHCAPAFGAEDFEVCTQAKIVRPDNIPCPLDANGRFTDQVKDFKGQYIKEKACERGLISAIKAQGRLVHETQFHHSYPFCWRSDTPLIYKTVSSWFIKVTDIKENLIKNNYKACWVPKNAQEGRFQNWLEDAKDWCFSRNRFWGNPIPIWVSEDFEEQICVGSVQELKELTGVDNITDLHRESIDHLTIPSKKGKGVLRRIDEVFDCWFESGSMPFASFHYPFSISEEEFAKRFPADFIGEGLDQTRGWFYTLNVLATAIKNDTPYKNLIVNGLVLAADGKKMSKRLKNYPDPQKLIDSKGADAIRLYLMNSPLTRADTLNFKEEGVAAIVRDVLLPWYNGYRFLIQNVTRWESNNNQKFQYSETYRSELTNLMDRWIIASNQHLIKTVRHEMDSYKLYNVLPKLLHFLEDLTNWYIRLNRGRLRGEFGETDWKLSLNVLTEVLFNITVLMSPFVPFITDGFYQNLRKIVPADSKLNQDSVHFIEIPKFDPNLIDEQIETDVERMQQVIELGRQIRDRRKVSLKQPIMSLTVISMQQQVLDSIKSVESYVQDELNVDRIEYTTEFSKYLSLHSQPDHKAVGARLKKQYTNELREKLAKLLPEEIAKIQKGEKITLNNIEFGNEDVEIVTKIKAGTVEEYQELAGQAEFHVLLDLRQDEAMKQRGITREVINRIQKLRKKLSLSPSDNVSIYIDVPEKSATIKTALSSQKELLSQSLKKPVDFGKPEAGKNLIAEEQFDFEDEQFSVAIVRN